MQRLKQIGQYLIDRLGETSTWIGFSAAITGAVALTGWKQYLVIAFGIIGVLAPQKSAGVPNA